MFSKLVNFVLFVFYRALKDLEEKRSHLSMGGRTGPNSIRDDQDYRFNIDELDFVPHFQRVSISGEDTCQVSSHNVQLDHKALISYHYL